MRLDFEGIESTDPHRLAASAPFPPTNTTAARMGAMQPLQRRLGELMLSICLKSPSRYLILRGANAMNCQSIVPTFGAGFTVCESLDDIGQFRQDRDADLLASYVNLKSLVPGVDEAIDEVALFAPRGIEQHVGSARIQKCRAYHRLACKVAVCSKLLFCAMVVTCDDDGSRFWPEPGFLSNGLTYFVMQCRGRTPPLLSAQKKRASSMPHA